MRYIAKHRRKPVKINRESQVRVVGQFRQRYEVNLGVYLCDMHIIR